MHRLENIHIGVYNGRRLIKITVNSIGVLLQNGQANICQDF